MPIRDEERCEICGSPNGIAVTIAGEAIVVCAECESRISKDVERIRR
jgi:ribosome-binding protein aMBF1 (putative translation factor)